MRQNKESFEYYAITVLFASLIFLCFLQVLFRFVLNLPLAWTEELSRFVFIALIYCGACAAAIEEKHVRVEIIDTLLSPGAKRLLDLIVRLLCSGISILVAVNTSKMIRNSYSTYQLSASLRLPMYTLYAAMAILFLLMAFRFLQSAWKILHSEGKDEVTV